MLYAISNPIPIIVCMVDYKIIPMPRSAVTLISIACDDCKSFETTKLFAFNAFVTKSFSIKFWSK